MGAEFRVQFFNYHCNLRQPFFPSLCNTKKRVVLSLSNFPTPWQSHILFMHINENFSKTDWLCTSFQVSSFFSPWHVICMFAGWPINPWKTRKVLYYHHKEKSSISQVLGPMWPPLLVTMVGRHCECTTVPTSTLCQGEARTTTYRLRAEAANARQGREKGQWEHRKGKGNWGLRGKTAGCCRPSRRQSYLLRPILSEPLAKYVHGVNTYTHTDLWE